MSTMFAMLPTALQSRLPPMRSLRKSSSMQTLKPASRPLASHAPSRSLSEIQLPLVQSQVVTETTEGSMSLVVTGRAVTDVSRAIPEDPVEQSVPAPSSGIDWRYAQQGFALVSVAQADRRPSARPGNANFERTAFLDGVLYFLKALPEDLDEHELNRIRSSMPASLAHSTAASSDRGFSPSRGSGQGRSLLHRSVQTAVVNIFILIHLALPYLILLLRLIARTEREYKVSENLVTVGMGLANTIGSKGVRMTGTICNMGDGKVGQVLTDVVAWMVEGVTGGLSEGVGEGLSIVGVKRQ